MAQEGPIPASPGALQERVNELQVRGPGLAKHSWTGGVPWECVETRGCMALCPLFSQRLRRELLEKQACVLGLHRELKATEHACSALQNNFQEFCQDLPRQQRQARALTDRYHAVGDQLDLR